MTNYRTYIFLLFNLISLSIYAQQTDCNEMIRFAQEDFEAGKYEQALANVENCLSTGSIEQITEIRKLRGRIFFELGKMNEAEIEVGELLKINNYIYTPTFDDQRFPVFLKLLEKVKISMSQFQVSSVSKNNESIEMTPATITVISEEIIKQRGYNNIEEVFHDISGFEISRPYGSMYSYLYQRGYRSSTATDRTLILIDGVEDNELFTGIAYISRQYPISNIKRIEIIYGPASTMYGSNAFAGTINIVTKNHSDYSPDNKTFTASSILSAGSFNTKNAEVNLSVQVKKVAATISAKIFNSNEHDLSGYPEWDYNWDANNFDASYYMTKLTKDATIKLLDSINKLDPANNFFTYDATENKIKPTTAAINTAINLDKTGYNKEINGKPVTFSNPTRDRYLYGKITIGDLKLGFQLWQLDEGAASQFTDLAFAGSNNFNNWSARQSFVYAKYEKILLNNLTFSSIAQYKHQQNYPNTSQTRFSSYATGSYDIFGLIANKQPGWASTFFYQQASQFRYESQLSYFINKRITAFAGFEYRNSQIQGDYITTTQPNPHINGKGGDMYNVDETGFYIQSDVKFKHQIKASVAGRIDNTNIRGNSKFVFNPRLAFIMPYKKFVFKTIYSEAYKEPTNYQKYSTGNTRLLNNPDLKAEKARNAEINIRFSPTLQNYFELVAYYVRYSNIVELRNVVYNDAGATTDRFESVGITRAGGIQFNSEYKLYNSLLDKKYPAGKYTLNFNYTYTSPYNISSDIPVYDIATHRASFIINNLLLNDRLNINAAFNFVGRKNTGKTDDAPFYSYTTIDPYLVINSTISIKGNKTDSKWLQATSLNLKINNLLNANYFHPGVRSANGLTFAGRIPQAPRNFIVSLLISI